MKKKSLTEKIIELKQKYVQQIGVKSSEPEKRESSLSEKDKQAIEKFLNNINSLYIRLQETTDKIEKRKTAAQIITLVKDNINKYPLTAEQAKSVYQILKSNSFMGISRGYEDSFLGFLESSKKSALRKFLDVVEMKVDSTDDIDELRNLKKLIIGENDRKSNFLLTETLKQKIDLKIARINSKNVTAKIENNISPEISKIINGIISGKLNISKAKVIIEKLAQKRVDSKPRTKFSLTQEQEVAQIIHQIAYAIENKCEEYSIKGAKTASTALEKLKQLGVNESLASKIVIKNLLANKRIKEATAVFKELKATNSLRPVFYESLEEEIKHAKISDAILEFLNQETTDITAKEQIFFQKLFEQIENGNVRPSKVILGKNADGKAVTLKDIINIDKKISH